MRTPPPQKKKKKKTTTTTKQQQTNKQTNKNKNKQHKRDRQTDRQTNKQKFEMPAAKLLVKSYANCAKKKTAHRHDKDVTNKRQENCSTFLQ